MVPSGGYLWWYVDALSDCGRYGLSIIAFVGSVFSPYYAWARRKGDVTHHERLCTGNPCTHKRIGENQLAPCIYLQKNTGVRHLLPVGAHHVGEKPAAGEQLHLCMANAPGLRAKPLTQELWLCPAAPHRSAWRGQGAFKKQGVSG